MNVFLIAACSISTVLLVAVMVLLLSTRKKIASVDEETLEKALREELRAGREESTRASRELRKEVAASLKTSTDSTIRTLSELGRLQKDELSLATRRIGELSESYEKRLGKLGLTVDERLKELQEGNEKKLEQMRETVGEKLEGALTKRLGESFRIVGAQLEAVQRGLGEMRNLAAGVGDLKNLLQNVKTRGTLGEEQLGAILEQILTPDQFDRNVRTNDESGEIVEFAVRLPGRSPGNEPVWLPIDSKFPLSDYEELIEASRQGDSEKAGKASAALIRAVRLSAKDICVKYLNPPRTTDFAILFLPVEGLYAEVLREPGIVSGIMREFRVVIAGPTTLSAILSSLRMGFRTLAIEKRSSEVWTVLGAVKTEFGRFGDVLDKLKRQLAIAAGTVESTGVRTRAIQRKLRDVEQLPSGEGGKILGLPGISGEPDGERQPEP